MVQLVSGEVAEDLAWYLTASEQIPSSVALGVSLGPAAEVAVAGGFLVQAMPGCDEELLATLEGRIRTLPPVTEILGHDAGPQELLQRLFAEFPFTVQARTDLVFRCTCTRHQVAGVLRALGREELLQLAAGEAETAVTCEFCKERYLFSPREVAALAPQ
jgi:molecular chaperone Hsp33